MRQITELGTSHVFCVKEGSVLVSREESRSWILWEMTSRMFPSWFDSGYMLASVTDAIWTNFLALVVDDPEIMQRQVPAFLRSVGVQAVQEPVEFPQVHDCGRPSAHAATSGRSSDKFIDKLMTTMKWDFRRIFTACFGLRPADVEAQVAETRGV